MSEEPAFRSGCRQRGLLLSVSLVLIVLTTCLVSLSAPAVASDARSAPSVTARTRILARSREAKRTPESQVFYLQKSRRPKEAIFSSSSGTQHSCPDGEFRCVNGLCILSKWRCDGIDDCGDLSDESDCPAYRGCPDNRISCDGNGQCVSREYSCDGIRDCANGADERNCDSYALAPLPPQPVRDSSLPVPAPATATRRPLPEREVQKASENERETRTDSKRTGDEGSAASDDDYGDEDDDDDDEQESNSIPAQNDDKGVYPSFPRRPPRPVMSTSSSTTTTTPAASSMTKGQSWNECDPEIEHRCADGTCLPLEHVCDGRFDCGDDEERDDCPLEYWSRLQSRVPGKHRHPGIDVRIYDSPQTQREGLDVVFRCREEGEERLPVIWSRPQNRSIQARHKVTDGRLTLFSVRPSDAGVYACRAAGMRYEVAFASLTVEERTNDLDLGGSSLAYRRAKATEESLAPTPSITGAGECVPRDEVCHAWRQVKHALPRKMIHSLDGRLPRVFRDCDQRD